MKIQHLFERIGKEPKNIAKRLKKLPDYSGLSDYRRMSKLDEWIQSALSDAVLISDESKFAMVYRSNGYIIRVTHRIDPGYEQWVKYSNTIKSPHVPEYYLSFRYAKTKNTVTIMEELTPLDKKTYKTVENLWEQNFTPAVNKFIQSNASFMAVYEMVEEWSKSVRLGRHVNVFGVKAGGVRVGFDAHGDNIMKRGNTLVITDPISYDLNDLHKLNEGIDDDLSDIEIIYMNPELEQGLDDESQ